MSDPGEWRDGEGQLTDDSDFYSEVELSDSEENCEHSSEEVQGNIKLEVDGDEENGEEGGSAEDPLYVAAGCQIELRRMKAASQGEGTAERSRQLNKIIQAQDRLRKTCTAAREQVERLKNELEDQRIQYENEFKKLKEESKRHKDTTGLKFKVVIMLLAEVASGREDGKGDSEIKKLWEDLEKVGDKLDKDISARGFIKESIRRLRQSLACLSPDQSGSPAGPSSRLGSSPSGVPEDEEDEDRGTGADEEMPEAAALSPDNTGIVLTRRSYRKIVKPRKFSPDDYDLPCPPQMKAGKPKKVCPDDFDCPRHSKRTSSKHCKSEGVNKALSVNKKVKSRENVFKCKTCTRSFDRLSHLKTHLEKVHDERYVGGKFGCRACGETFSSMRQICQHRKAFHPRKR